MSLGRPPAWLQATAEAQTPQPGTPCRSSSSPPCPGARCPASPRTNWRATGRESGCVALGAWSHCCLCQVSHVRQVALPSGSRIVSGSPEVPPGAGRARFAGSLHLGRVQAGLPPVSGRELWREERSGGSRRSTTSNTCYMRCPEVRGVLSATPHLIRARPHTRLHVGPATLCFQGQC